MVGETDSETVCGSAGVTSGTVVDLARVASRTVDRFAGVVSRADSRTVGAPAGVATSPLVFIRAVKVASGSAWVA